MTITDSILEHKMGVEEYNGIPIILGPECHSNCVRGYGNIASGVVFVGISPARDEMRSRRPLTGPSGQLLNNTLKGLGLSRKDVYCTNIICTWKTEPTNTHAKECATRLRAELLALQPKLIITLGKLVSEEFFGRQFGKIRGAVQWSDEYNCYILSTYHPAAIFHAMGEYGSSKDDKATSLIYDFVRDLRKIPMILDWQVGAPQANITYTVVDNIIEAQQALNSLSRDEPVGIDVETKYEKDNDDAEALEDLLICVGVGDTKHAFVFTRNALYNTDGTSALIWPALKWTAHYSNFDTQIMKRCLGVDIVVHEDTLLQSYSLDERSGIHKLKPLTREYLAAPFYEETKGGYVASPQLYEYNARDVVYMMRLQQLFEKWQREDNVRDMYEKLLIPAVNVYREMQYYGIKVDKDKLMAFGAEWGAVMLQKELELQDMAEQEGWQGRINLSSPQQLAAFLFQYLSLPIQKRTPAGQPSTDKEVLEKLSEQHPFVAELLEYRHWVHMFDNYISGLYRQIREDGRAHAITKLHGTRTGRPSYVKPALQTIPVPYNYPDTFGKLRQLFTASEGNILVEADYGKAEIWVAYSYSKDKQLLADLTSGDYHTTVAMDVFNKKRESITGDDRLRMKRVTFGILYDREAPSLSKAIQRTVIEAQSYINSFFKRNKEYAVWFKQTQTDIRKTGELISATGRKRRIIILGSAVRALKQAVNFKIQATTSDVILDAVIELHPLIKVLGGHLLLTVHDSIVAEVPKDKEQECAAIMHSVMTKRHFDDIIQMPIEIKTGVNWGQVKEIHDCAKERCLW